MNEFPYKSLNNWRPRILGNYEIIYKIFLISGLDGEYQTGHPEDKFWHLH